MAVSGRVKNLSPGKALEPGSAVDVIPERENTFLPLHPRRCKVLGVEDGDLVISFPDPPLPSPVLGKAVSVSFVLDGEKGPQRLGFFSLVLDVVNQKAEEQGQPAALVVVYPGERDLGPMELRRLKRHPVPPNGNLKLHLEELDSVRLMDISRQGLRFAITKNKNLAPGQKLAMNLCIKDRDYLIHGQVLQVRPGDHNFQVSVLLETLSLDVWTGLEQALLEIKRNNPVI